MHYALPDGRSMEKCEMLASASDVIIIALKIFGYREDGTSYKKTLLLLI